MYGKNHSDESKTKISDALTGENNPMFNKPRPERIRKTLSSNRSF